MAAFLFLALWPGMLLAEPLHVSVAEPTVLVPDRYILATDPAHDVLRVTLQTTVSRNAFCPAGDLLLPCPATNVFVRYTVRLMREAIEVVLAQWITNYSIGGTSMLNVEEILELSPAALLKDGAQHYIAYEIAHIEDPANGQYVEDQSGDSAPMTIAHFTGPLRFGSVGTTLQQLAANPAYLGAVGWSLNIAQGVTSNGYSFSHTATVPPPVVAVRDDAGELTVSSGSVQVTGAGSFEWMGWSGKRGVTRLSTSGFVTDSLTLDLPPGIGWRFAGERKLRAQFQLPASPIALDANLNPSVSLSGTATNSMQFFTETVLAENPNFTGVYVYGAGTFPIYSFSCLLKVNVGAEVSAFAGTHLGGRIGGSVSGEALCLVSAKGEASLAYVQSGDEKLYQGDIGLNAKIGPCPFCAKWEKHFNATYAKTAGWDF